MNGRPVDETAEKSAEGIVSDANWRRPEFINIKDAAKMRKDSSQQKNEKWEQLRLFTITGEPVGDQTSGTGKINETGVELFSRLEQQRSLTVNILERIVEYGNLDKAYRQVRSNQGSCGPDGMEVDELRQWIGNNLKELQETILKEEYQVNAVRKVEIPKAGGGVRMLGIPTVKDRLIQQAIHQELNRYYEPWFSDYSYGFRTGRNSHQAILQASAYVAEGKEWVVDIDLEKFFDTINHDRLMQRLSKGIGDKRLLRLINAYLKAGMMSDGLMEQRVAGTPQGSPLSPLLSNIILDELDREVESRGLSFCRYADDCNIFVRSRKAGERVLKSLTNFIEKKLKLKVNRDKSGVRHCSEVKFLGYTIMQGGNIRVADKSIDRLKHKVKEMTRRNRGVKFEQIVKELNVMIVGWANYFRLANCWLRDIKDLDQWIRRKLRCYRLKQCGRKYTIFKLLHSMGIAEKTSWYVVLYSQGWWAMSNRMAVNKAMNLTWFSQQGLRSIQSTMGFR